MSIYYLCPHSNSPCGGIKVIYRHVDILNSYGFDAYVLHEEDGFRCEWFNNQTSIAYLKSKRYRRIYNKIHKVLRPHGPRKIPIKNGKVRYIGTSDYLVIPENYGPDISQYGRGIPKFIINQNGFLSFSGYSFSKSRLITPYNSDDVIGTLVNSKHAQDYVTFAFQDKPTYRFYLSINPQLFNFKESKKKQICFSRVKNISDAMQITNLLKFRGNLYDFEIMPFLNISEQEVATLLNQSLIFLSLGNREGFGLPPAEAMASGCITIGYHGWGGKEFFNSAYSFPINDGDILKFVETIEMVIKNYNNDPSFFLTERKRAANFIASTYSPQNEEKTLIDIWRVITTVN